MHWWVWVDECDPVDDDDDDDDDDYSDKDNDNLCIVLAPYMEIIELKDDAIDDCDDDNDNDGDDDSGPLR